MSRKIYKPGTMGGASSGGLNETQINALLALKANQTDLVNVSNNLNTKADLTLLNDKADVSALTPINVAISQRSLLNHKHVIADITDYTGGSGGSGGNTSSNIVTPTVNTPFANVGTTIPLNYTITASNFTLTSGTDTHQSSDWEVSTNSNFTNVILSSYSNTTNLTSWPVTFPNSGTVYYARVKYKSSSGAVSSWSTVVSFPPTEASGTGIVVVAKPSVFSPFVMVGGTVPLSNDIISSAFTLTSGNDTHDKTEWKIAENTSDMSSVVGTATTYTGSSLGSLILLKYVFAKYGTNYYVACRYKTATGVYSPWSDGTLFMTQATGGSLGANTIDKPTVNGPFVMVGGTVPINNNIITSSGYIYRLGNGQLGNSNDDPHTSSDWQVATDPGFTTIVMNNSNSYSLTSWTCTFPAANTTYYVRVRYKSTSGLYSPWSAGTVFITSASVTNIIATPNIDMSNLGFVMVGATVPKSYTINTTPFAMTAGTDTHLSTDWEISSNSSFSNIVLANYSSGTNKTSWPVIFPSYNTTYYVRARHKGASGIVSNWSPVQPMAIGNT